MMLKDFKNNKLGFTLIEMIVSLGVFSMVVTTAVGAMLVLISTNQRLQGEHGVMTNLSFALDTMTRELRTGYKYYCAQGIENIFVAGSAHESTVGINTQDCPNGRAGGQFRQGVSFYEGGNSLTGGGAKRILYYYDTTTNPKTIMRRVGNGIPQSIISSDLIITDAQFYVSGSNELSSTGDAVQPTITIYIEAQDKDLEKTYYLQTTIAQRSLDI